MCMETNSLSDEKKNPRYIMNKSDKQNSIYRRIAIESHLKEECEKDLNRLISRKAYLINQES